MTVFTSQNNHNISEHPVNTTLYLNDPIGNTDKYTIRPTVKVVIFNQKGEILLFNSLLVGGGVEHDESLINAAYREAIEEAGATLNTVVKLATISHYREQTKLKYVVHGFMAAISSQTTPTTNQTDELNKPLEWMNLTQAKTRLKANLAKLNPTKNEPKYYNTLTALKLINIAQELVKTDEK